MQQSTVPVTIQATSCQSAGIAEGMANVFNEVDL